jgi:hypothetical protein
MDNNPETSKNAVADKIEAMFGDATTLFNKGVERKAQVQKQLLDLAAQQNAEALATCKKLFQAVPSMPGLFLFDMAAQAFDNYVAVQKNILSLVVDQSFAFTAYATQARKESPEKTMSGFTDMMRQSVERGVAVQKSVLDTAAQHNDAASETVKRELSGTPAAAVADSIQVGVNAIIETQKEVLDIAAKPLKRGAAAK